MRIFTWQMAEVLAQEHMRALGFADAVTTGSGADGGVDVRASGAIAQVKHYASPVGVAGVQRLRGTAHDGLEALFYASNGYSRSAREFAEEAGMALFELSESFEGFPVSNRATSLNERSVQNGELTLAALRKDFDRLRALRNHVVQIYDVVGSVMDQGGAGTVETDLPADYLKSTIQLWVDMLESGQLKSLLGPIDNWGIQLTPVISEINIAIEKEDLERAAGQIWEAVCLSRAVLEEVEAQFPVPIDDVPI